MGTMTGRAGTPFHIAICAGRDRQVETFAKAPQCAVARPRNSRLSYGCLGRRVLIGAKPEQRADVSDLVQSGIVFHVEQFDVTLDCCRDEGIANILQLTCLVAANGAELHHVSIEMAAFGTFNSMGAE